MFEFILPDLGEGIHEGELIQWHVKEGDTVTEDEPLCDMETDKATVTIPSPRAGTIARLNGNPGDIISVGSVLLVIQEDGKGTGDVPAPKPPGAEVTAPAPAPVPESAGTPAQRPPGERAIAAPATRRLARERGIDINQVPGTGPGGRVTPGDLDAFGTGAVPVPEAHEAESAPAQSPARELPPAGIPFFAPAELPDFAAQGPVTREPIRSLRRKTAEKTATSMIIVPHVAHMEACDVTGIEALRQQLNHGRDPAQRMTLMAFVIRAMGSLLKAYPAFNASVDPGRMEIVYKEYVNIGFAADTPKGLMVPVIQGADRLSVSAIAETIQALALKGREGRIALEDLSAGTFTVTNVGAIGGTGMVPTINYPESAILGMGRVGPKPVVRGEDIAVRQILPVTLCFDHRVADGVQAARFVNAFKEMLEDPAVFMTRI